MSKCRWIANSLGRMLLAAGVLAGSVQAREITCYSTQFPPYVIENGSHISGVDVDIVKEAGRRAGVDVTFRLLPWVRLENEIRHGAASMVECAFAYTSNESRKTYMDFMQVPLKVTMYTLFAKRGRLAGGMAELKGKTIGLRRGFIVPGAFEEMRKRQEVVVEETDSDISNFRKLTLERIDGIITNADVGRAVLAGMGASEIVAVEPAIVQTPTFLVFNKAKNLSSLAVAFDKALLEMQNDGSVNQIRLKYLR